MGSLTKAAPLRQVAALDILHVREALRAGPEQRDVHSSTGVRKTRLPQRRPMDSLKEEF